MSCFRKFGEIVRLSLAFKLTAKNRKSTLTQPSSNTDQAASLLQLKTLTTIVNDGDSSSNILMDQCSFVGNVGCLTVDQANARVGSSWNTPIFARPSFAVLKTGVLHKFGRQAKNGNDTTDLMHQIVSS